MKGISDLTRKITTWSRADDRRLYRFMSYLKGTSDYMLEGHIRDDPSTLHLSLYTDADHASGIEDVKSTSGRFLTLEGPDWFWPLRAKAQLLGALVKPRSFLLSQVCSAKPFRCKIFSI